MKWTRPGFEHALTGLLESLNSDAWPEPPPGFEPVERTRPMRVVLHGTVTTDEGPLEVALKWSRSVTQTDAISRRLRGGKGPREGAVLRALRAAGVAAVEPLAYTDDGTDLLVTEWVPDLIPLECPDALGRADLAALAHLVRSMHLAGIRHRDLHIDNILIGPNGPMLVDLGGARTGRPVPAADDARVLAGICIGLLGGASRTTRVRALRAWCAEAGLPDETARLLLPQIERPWQNARRKFLRGRDRRATREGRHFHVFATPTTRQCIRNTERTDARFEEAVDGWLAAGPDGADGERLKAGGRVRRVAAPSEIDGARHVVVKYYLPISAGRLPRPLHAFRVGEALTTRGIPVPRPLLAAARGDGSGVLVSTSIDASNLHAFFEEHRAGLPRSAWRRLLTYLGRTLRQMHDAEVSHRDLKAPNLLVAVTDGEPSVWIADLDGARVRSRPVSWSRRMKDLARLDASLPASAPDRLRVFDAYARVPPWPTIDRRRLLAGVAHHVARKRGPSNAPR